MNLWRNITVGNLGEVITGYTPPTKNAEYFGDVYPFITPTDIKIDSRTVQTERFLSQEGYEYNKNRLLPSNAVCVTCIASIGKICMTTVPSITNQQINSVVVNQDKYDPYFVYYLLLTKTDVIQSVANSATTPIVNKSTFASINVCVPTLPTQTQIANFLDQKTEQIDELIRIKERWIELLQEQRTALINQAVTKGLDPNVEMKPSGVEWIGEIPGHWNLAMLKYAARLVYGDTLISENREDGVVPVYGSNGMIDTHSSANALSPAIIIGRKGSLGKVQYSDVSCFVIDTAYYIDRRTSNLNLRWLYYILQALKLERFRNSVLPGLNRESAESQYVPLITEEEQTQIANFLDQKTKQIDELITAEQRKIELLKEYRQSLISEAVTGKIDVRHEV